MGAIEDRKALWSELRVKPDQTPEELARRLDAVARGSDRALRRIATDYLYVFDESICWLHAFYDALMSARRRCGKPYLLAPWALTGAAAVQSAAIRRLFLSGLAAPVKPVVRSLLETIDMAVVASYNKAFAFDFWAAEESGRTGQFWHEQVARGQLHKSVHPTFFEALSHVFAVPPRKPARFRQSLLGQPDLRMLGVLASSVEGILYFTGMLFRPVALGARIGSAAPLLRFLSVRSTVLLVAQAGVAAELSERYYAGLARESHRVDAIDEDA